MIEYLFNTIRATAGDVAAVSAVITDDNGTPITSGCEFMLHDCDENLLKTVMGDYKDGEWTFHVPTEGLPKGKYFYCICMDGEKLCFHQRMYLI